MDLDTELKLDAARISRDGEELSGALDDSVYGFDDEFLKPFGGLRYELGAMLVGNELLVRGKLEMPVNDEDFVACLDIGHVNAYSNVPVMEWLEKCDPYISHFHIHNNDTSRDSHSQLFEGTIPMTQLLNAIEEKCPSASITLELMDAKPSIDWLLKEADLIWN